MVNERIRRMTYMKDFKCIGSSCTDNCCIGWDVDIDIETYKGYKSRKDSPLFERLSSDVILNNDCYDKGIDYGRMVLSGTKRCPFLASDDLCDIQRTHGETALSKVCNAYPRVVNLVDGVLELSATMSCPEVARMVLLDGGSLMIEEADVDASRFIITQQVATKDPSLKHHPAKYFNELRAFSMDLLKNSDYPLVKRLHLLGEMHERILPMHASGNIEGVPATLKKCKNKVLNKEYVNYLKKLRPDYRQQLNFFIENTNVLDGDKQIENQTFGKLLKAAKQGLEIKRSKPGSNSYSLYELNAIRHVEPFMVRHERIFENYIVNTMYKSMYPFSEQGDPYAGYTMLVVRVFLIKAVLIGLCANKVTLTPTLAVEVIQSFSKTLEHHKTFMNDLLQQLMESGSDELKYLSKLL
ncbi:MULTISPECIES: flagellin lysine-N-methylase [unclassified Fusibacter]|uniref:flagellin lysine-N-methylase n=1 Tax=unclassified Fusibacter TaxID=2624464 RepID=UPI00101028AF|nr:MULTISPECIES: flagellin lysine-N-methylase [unclassified Fusibacter]MCK8060340.1 flagellin lysine-N-methylase [Fusibacter sp. A2]NPE20371.1 hypothetical protein [Fusibacter sp. A1]RXV63577.1 hypothetical protein DWB64_00965 [Fusibacter sp. A1]